MLGKRSKVRRSEDRQKFHILERHGPKALAAILLIIMLSVLDAFFTLYLISKGASELNPIMNYFLEQSPIVFFGVKFFY